MCARVTRCVVAYAVARCCGRLPDGTKTVAEVMPTPESEKASPFLKSRLGAKGPFDLLTGIRSCSAHTCLSHLLAARLAAHTGRAVYACALLVVT